MKLTRRDFFKFFTGGAILLTIFKILSINPINAIRDVIRPPGAVEEHNFNLLCIRCGICLEVCPTKCIIFAGLYDGVREINTPKIDAEKGPCEFYRGRCKDEMLCSKHCPTGALQLVDKDEAKMGTVDFYPDYCLAYLGKECVICGEMCPVSGAIETTEDLKPIFDNEKCVGCGTCVYSCPSIPKALSLSSKDSRRVRLLR